jgi:hypothetical protein
MMNFNKKPVLILIVIIPVILLGATIFLLFENENMSTPISSYSSDSTNVVDSLNNNEVGINQNDTVFSHDEKIIEAIRAIDKICNFILLRFRVNNYLNILMGL